MRDGYGKFELFTMQGAEDRGSFTMKISKRKFAEALNKAWEELKAEDSEMANLEKLLRLAW